MSKFLLMAALLATLAPSCQAATLSELMAGGEVTSGGLLFSDFGYVAAAGLPTADLVTVSAVIDAEGDSGLRFGWEMLSIGQSQDLDATLTYHVETINPERHLAAARMRGDLQGMGILTVTQTFADFGPGSFDNFIYVRSGSVRNMDEVLPQHFNRRGRYRAHDVSAVLSGGNGSISFFEHTYAVPEPSADFDVDGDVDGADFLAWQRGLGHSSPSKQHGDANIDGRVDQDDLSIWQANFGGGGEVAVVPEPGITSFALIFAALIARQRQRGPTATLEN